MTIWYSASGGERASIFNLWLAVSNRTCLLYVEISNEVSFRTRIAGRPHCSNRKLPLKIISMKMHRTEEGESACSPFHRTANVLACPPVSRPVKVFAPDLDWKAPTIVIERRRRHCRRPPTLLLLRHACVACISFEWQTRIFRSSVECGDKNATKRQIRWFGSTRNGATDLA